MNDPLVVESAKFLKELQAEAINSITNTIASADNSINFSGFIIMASSITGNLGTKWVIKVQINGKEMVIEKTVNLHEVLSLQLMKHEIAISVFNAVKQHLEQQIAPVLMNIKP